MTDELAVAFADVRKAYRLLWCYQRRIYDMVELVAAEFPAMRFYYWQTQAADRPPTSGASPLQRSPWGMLPLVRASFLYLPEDADNNVTCEGQWMLEIHLDSDTGYPNDFKQGAPDPDPSTFPSVELSATTLVIYAWYCTKTTKQNWFNEVYSRLNWPEADGVLAESTKPAFRVVGKTFDLTTLATAEDITTAVASFRAMARASLGTPLP